MRYLFIDTAHGAGAAWIDSESEENLGVAETADTRSQVEDLAGLVAKVVPESETPDFVVVSRGPAPFTGLRVGLVSARTFGFAWGVPVFGLDELELLAAAGNNKLLSAEREQEWVIPCVDARRHEVYAALFRRGSNGEPLRQGPDWVGASAELPRMLTQWDATFPNWSDSRVVAVGNAANQLEGVSPLEVALVDQAKAAGGLVVTLSGGDLASLRGKTQTELAVLGLGTEPEYLRRPDIQEKK
ncbi:MAG: tRNA (adenosine(37)-N6)-threonylcarbamoyltransferase complex dimerization subunit type 1 TsaB [Mobiluncus porci]|uniref:tRNA (adenosine(37)-N6)-threonylcarbamoyltransferase complex dimerization subunit type 1 TsaB n=1 Tax=Mobiluncus porci TaxID=2652278 RepID=UPI0023F48BBF|nr:tRNA (adenosine(37)-N6)-threonylcarbamoyltransferase complex dimerization subunit type 1 TsaB [Mobiluncus porci]MDD7541259.1 tRNA (adenosine(37)-N6)-threonylcarbamoyltransferase complex dimerization subunit type 1 TsaB [Mobiluncus porci]MDY5749467.1 tRNA (adenosine(37)-N6)-threonylcarbamoyltransferase complex dimerization subunit type 1 TsaB [Mobiluncus porci]